MKKTVLILAALMAVSATPALAQKKGKGEGAETRPLPPRPEFTTGVVASYVPETRTLKLNTGGDYHLSPAAGNAVFKAGDKVQLRWMIKGGLRIADQAILAAAAPNVGKASVDKPPAAATPAATPADHS